MNRQKHGAFLPEHLKARGAVRLGDVLCNLCSEGKHTADAHNRI
ncbi:hypothetical protein [Canibacter zhuwentaonis]|nr:hypothetical protein [Canibacter zhuwentaonis]